MCYKLICVGIKVVYTVKVICTCEWSEQPVECLVYVNIKVFERVWLVALLGS